MDPLSALSVASVVAQAIGAAMRALENSKEISDDLPAIFDLLEEAKDLTTLYTDRGSNFENSVDLKTEYAAVAIFIYFNIITNVIQPYTTTRTFTKGLYTNVVESPEVKSHKNHTRLLEVRGASSIEEKRES
jgi:hypothetical protein